MEACDLVRRWCGGMASRFATLDNVDAARARTGTRDEDARSAARCRCWDIGPGQQLRHMRSFSVDNDVRGIDMDIIPQDFRWTEYADMLRRNSGVRVAKTLARKALGFDRRFIAELAKRLGVDRFRTLDVDRMDATTMTFSDASFDCVYSYSVFEHIDRPEAALEAVRRVLAPGGVAYISVHLYTSHCGQHDPKMLLQAKPEPPYWPHLRPHYAASVHPSAYLNEVRYDEWKAMFERVMPGVVFEHERQDDDLAAPLRELRAAGELTDYSDDELLTLNLIGIWSKPLEHRTC